MPVRRSTNTESVRGLLKRKDMALALYRLQTLVFDWPQEDGPEMASVNKAILIGNLGRDPEIRYLPSGQPVASFSIATTETFNERRPPGTHRLA